jgi:uncharacterized protein (DUF58 family)
MVSIFHTYRNLAGLTLLAGTSQPAFAGEDAEFMVILNRLGARTYEALLLGWDAQTLQSADLIEDEELRLRLFVKSNKRGVMNPGRMLIETFYPVGLFRAWSWVDLDMSTIVYPNPIAAGPMSSVPSDSDDGDFLVSEGTEDFYGLRDYQPSDSPRHIAWKSYARSEELLTKQFGAYADKRVWLEWESFSGMDREARLSRLCYWVIQLSNTHDEYGLRLPGIEIEPGRGNEHRDAILKALALFEIDQ